MPSYLGRLFGDPGTPVAADEALRKAVVLRVTAGDMEIYAIPKVPQDLMAHQCINQGVQSEADCMSGTSSAAGVKSMCAWTAPLIYTAPDRRGAGRTGHRAAAGR